MITKLKRLEIKLTDECNMFCIYCSNSDGKNSNKLDTDKLFKSFALLKDKGIVLDELLVTGGEPLLSIKNAVSVFDFFSPFMSNNSKKIVATNGVLINDDYVIDSLKDAKIDQILISLDTLSRDKFKHMTKTNYLDDVIKGIKRAREMFKSVVVRCTLSTLNKDDLVDLYKYCSNIPIDEFQVKPVMPSGRAEWSLILHPNELLNSIKNLLDVKSDLRINLRGCYLPPCEKKEISIADERLVYHSCPAANSLLYIDVKGDLYPCNYFSEDSRLGSIYNDDIVNVWKNSTLLNTIRNSRPEKCKKCNQWDLCRNHCMSVLEQEKIDLAVRSFDFIMQKKECASV